MSWKKTDLERLKAASITDRLRKSRAPARYGRDSAILGWQKQFKLDQRAIAALVAAREAAWNAGDTAAYAQLLTEDADIISATGRPARGRKALLKLFAEQHANVFAGVRTHTKVTHVRMLGKDVALADVEYQLEGGNVDAIRRGIMAFIVRKDASRWRIAVIRSIPGR
jgi:uncharacterized protein (TIGR02246 family)